LIGSPLLITDGYLYGNRDCQASKGFDKHVPDGDAGFCWCVGIYLDCWDLGNTLMRISKANASAAVWILIDGRLSYLRSE